MQKRDGSWRQLGRQTDFSDGAVQSVDVAGLMLAVGRVGDRYFAVDNCCPHAGGSLGAGRLEGPTLVCPLHAWDFDVFSGECARFAKKITSYPVRVQDGMLEVCC